MSKKRLETGKTGRLRPSSFQGHRIRKLFRWRSLACECSANPQIKYIVGLLLLTGARKSELLNAKWQHIDLVRRSWKLPMTKNGRGRHVSLSQPAIDIINQLPKFAGCPYLVSNPATLKSYSDIKRGWEAARKLVGLEDVHLHDLRHTACSWMIAAGVDIYTVGKSGWPSIHRFYQALCPPRGRQINGSR
jgi:integrase